MAGMRFVNKHITALHSVRQCYFVHTRILGTYNTKEDFSQIQKDSLFTYNFAEIKSDLSKILVGHTLDYLQLWYSTVLACFQGRRKRQILLQERKPLQQKG